MRFTPSGSPPGLFLSASSVRPVATQTRSQGCQACQASENVRSAVVEQAFLHLQHYATPLVLAGSESEGPEHLDFTRTQRTKVGPSPTADFAHSVSKSDAAVLAPWLLVPVEQGRDPCFLKACRL